MSEHLPECSQSLPKQSPMDFHLDFPRDCICDRLERAVDDERRRIRDVIADYYKVAPKAALPLLRRLFGDGR